MMKRVLGTVRVLKSVLGTRDNQGDEESIRDIRVLRVLGTKSVLGTGEY